MGRNTPLPLQSLRISLSRRALSACHNRGHRMSRIKWSFQYDNPHVANPVVRGATGSAHCLACDATLTLRTHPAPNEIDISGEAVAITCPYDSTVSQPSSPERSPS